MEVFLSPIDNNPGAHLKFEGELDRHSFHICRETFAYELGYSNLYW